MRIVVVGLGWVAREIWLPRLRRHPKFQVVAAVEPQPAAVARAAPLIDDVPVYPRHTDVPLDGVDGVFVLTPNHTHGQIGEWFLRRGRLVFLEKPTGTDRGQLDLLATAARHGDGRLVLSAAARHRADVGALRDLAAAGVFGMPRLADLSWVRSRGIPNSQWFTQRATAGGGVLVDLGWHVIDVVHQLWGASPVRGVAAVASADFLGRAGWEAIWQGATPAGGTSGAAGPDVEDQLTGLVATDAYAMRLRFAWASHEEIDQTVIELHGTDASAVLTTTFGFSPRRVVSPSLVLKRGGSVEPVPLPTVEIGAEYDRQLDALVHLMADGDATDRALTEVYQVLAVVDACYRAADLR